jgi:hypothetical protein
LPYSLLFLYKGKGEEMGLKIADLLKWKRSIILLDQEGNPVLDDKNKPITVFLRVIGDDDLEKSHRAARLKSATIRKDLLDESSLLYMDRVAPISEASRQDCIDILVQYRTSNLEAEARANVERPDEPTLEEVAIDPDAASLEEQEKLDKAIEKQNKEYAEAIKDYIDTRAAVIRAEVEAMSDEDLHTLAKVEISGVMALSEFFTELMNQKIFRGTFVDDKCKERAFETIEEVKDASPVIRQQLFDAYLELEFEPDKIKK